MHILEHLLQLTGAQPSGFGALAAVASPDARDVPFAAGGDADDHVHRLVADLTVADLDDDGWGHLPRSWGAMKMTR